MSAAPTVQRPPGGHEQGSPENEPDAAGRPGLGGPASAHYLAWARAPGASGPRYIATAVLALLAWAVGTLLVVLPMAERGFPESPAAHLLVVTGSFAVGFLALPWLVRRILRRPAWSVVAARFPGPVWHFGIGVAVCLLSVCLVDLLVTPFAPVRAGQFQLAAWLPLAAAAMLGFLVQAGFEELLFRGLLMQATARRTSRAGLVIGLPALLFGAMHWGNLAGLADGPLQIAPYLVMGATFGWAAWYSGSLWLPFGMHWANNVYATLAITTQGDVVPNGAPLVRDLAAVPLEALMLMVAVQGAAQVVAIHLLVRRVPLPWPTRASGPTRYRPPRQANG